MMALDFGLAASRRTRMKVVCILSVVIGLLLAAGCSTLVERPATPSEALKDDGMSFGAAATYLDAARAKLMDAQDAAVRLDSATKVGAGVGIVGAGVAALFRGSTDLILGFLTLGGTSYTTNQVTRPNGVADVYSAGIKSLQCIEESGRRTYQATRDTRGPLAELGGELRRAVARLNDDINAARSDDSFDTTVAMAHKTIEAAGTLLASVDRYMADSDVGEAMYSGVNRTINAVNDEVRKQSPDITAVSQSGSILTSYFNSHAGLRSEADASVASVLAGKAQARTQGSDSALQRQFDRDTNDVARLIAAIRDGVLPSPLPPATSLSKCQVTFASDEVLSINPAGSVALTPGGDAYTIRAEGKPPFTLHWAGPTPSASEILVSNAGGSEISLAAPAASKAHDYAFYIERNDTRSLSATIKLSVGGAAQPEKPPATPQKGVRTTKPLTQDDLIKKFSFDVLRSKLGLPTTVLSATDPAWKNRVNKLDACFSLKPISPEVTAPLVSALESHKQVASDGSCPARADAPAVAAAGGRVASSPPPPVSLPATGASSPVPHPPPHD